MHITIFLDTKLKYYTPNNKKQIFLHLTVFSRSIVIRKTEESWLTMMMTTFSTRLKEQISIQHKAFLRTTG